MSTIVFRPFRRVSLWTSLVCLLILSLFVAACGGDSGATSAPPASSQPAANSASGASAPTGNTMTVMISEKTGGQDIYSFDPPTLNVKVGTSVKWVNNSDENHLLASTTPGIFNANSIVMRSGSNDNTMQMTFDKPGTYVYTSTLVKRLPDHTPEGMSSSAQGTIVVAP